MFEKKAIRDNASKDFKLENDSRLELAVDKIYDVWPSVAREMGSFSVVSNQKPFVAKLYTLTNLRGEYLNAISQTIRKLYGNGKLDTSFYAPATQANITAAKVAESEKSPSWLDTVTGGGFSKFKTYAKWGLLAVAVLGGIGLFFYLKAATAPLRKGFAVARNAKKLLSNPFLGKEEEKEEETEDE